MSTYITTCNIVLGGLNLSPCISHGLVAQFLNNRHISKALVFIYCKTK